MTPGNPGSIKEIGAYQLIAKIGQGAMGSVFKARQKSMDRIVALKVLRPSIAQRDPKFVERFLREARASAALNHPNIVQGIDVGQDEALGFHYFAMEFIDGPSLLTILKREGKLEEQRALEIVLKIADALAFAHESGIVHRDIKPDNILMTSRGVPKLSDLGLARKFSDDTETDEDEFVTDVEDISHSQKDAALTQAGAALGTPYYMAPEQVLGQTDLIGPHCDLYALGATLFHLITGQPPFQGNSPGEIMDARLDGDIPDAHVVNPGISVATARLIKRLMQIEIKERLSNADELSAEIKKKLALLKERTTTGPRKPIGQTTGKKEPIGSRDRFRERQTPPRSSSTLYIGGGAGLLVLGILGYLFMGTGNNTKPGTSMDPHPDPKKLAVTEKEQPVGAPTRERGQEESQSEQDVAALKKKDSEQEKPKGGATDKGPSTAPNTKTKTKTAGVDPAQTALTGESGKRTPPEHSAEVKQQSAQPAWKTALAQLNLPAARKALDEDLIKQGLDAVEKARAKEAFTEQIEKSAKALVDKVAALLDKGQVKEAATCMAQVNLGAEDDDSLAMLTARAILSVGQKRLDAALETVPPAPPPLAPIEEKEEEPEAKPDPMEPSAEDLKALEDLRFDLSTLLAVKNVDAAEARVKKAVADATGLQKILFERELQALDWIEAMADSERKGAEKLKDGRAFTLHLKDGKSEEIGNARSLRMASVAQDQIRLQISEGNVSATRTFSFEELSPHTRLDLALIGAEGDKQALARTKMQAVYARLATLGLAEELSTKTLDRMGKLLGEAQRGDAPKAMLELAQSWLKRVSKSSQVAESKTPKKPTAKDEDPNGKGERKVPEAKDANEQKEEKSPGPEGKKPESVNANPFQKARVGDWVTYCKLGDEGTSMTFRIVSIDGDRIDIRNSMMVQGFEIPPETVHLSRTDPFEPSLGLLDRAKIETRVGPEIRTRAEAEVTLDGTPYHCEVLTVRYQLKDTETVMEHKVWLNPDVLLYGVVKIEDARKGGTGTWFLEEFGRK